MFSTFVFRRLRLHSSAGVPEASGSVVPGFFGRFSFLNPEVDIGEGVYQDFEQRRCLEVIRERGRLLHGGLADLNLGIFFGVVRREIKLAEGCAFLQGIVTGAKIRNVDSFSAARACGSCENVSGKRAYSAETGDDRGVSAIAKGLERRILPQKKQMMDIQLPISDAERKKFDRCARVFREFICPRYLKNSGKFSRKSA